MLAIPRRLANHPIRASGILTSRGIAGHHHLREHESDGTTERVSTSFSQLMF
jgi:hypothetical protein